MQASLEVVKGLERKLIIEVPEQELKNEYNARIQQVSREANIKGFRPGKVPKHLIEKRYGGEIRSEALNHVIRTSLDKAVADEQLKVAGEMNITEVKAENGTNLRFVSEFEILPTIKLKDLMGIEIEKLTANIEPEDIQATIENLRKRSPNWHVVDRAAKKEDRVTIDFEGFKDDKAVKNTRAQNFVLVVGSGRMHVDFENALESKKAGDTFEIDIQYPENMANKDIAGQKIHFSGKVHQVEESSLPEINEEFLKQLGIDGGIEALEKEVKETMEYERDQVLKNLNKQAILNRVLEMHPDLELPQGLLKAEMKSLHHGHHHAEGETCAHSAGLEEQAKRRVALGLLVGEFAQQQKIKADPQKIQQLIQGMAMNHPRPQEVMKWYYEDEKRVAPLVWIALEDQVGEKLLETAVAKEKVVRYADAVRMFQEMQRNQGG